MCLAMPGRVVSLDGRMAQVDFGGIRRELALDLVPEVEEGDWVLAHAGFAIQRLEEEDAMETIALFKELEEVGEAEGDQDGS